MNKSTIGLFSLFAIALILSSCKKDPYVDLIGTWDIEGDKGEVTFNDDGTGYAILNNYSAFSNPELIYFDNMCSSNDTSYFNWSVVSQDNDKGILELSYMSEDSTCSGTTNPKYNFYVGPNEVNFGNGFNTVDLHKRK